MKVNKSALIDTLTKRFPNLPRHDVEQAVKTLIESMSRMIAAGERIEIRGFGSFSLHYRAPGVKRNPKTGDSVAVGTRFVVHFRPGKELRHRVTEHTKSAARGDGHPTPRS